MVPDGWMTYVAGLATAGVGGGGSSLTLNVHSSSAPGDASAAVPFVIGGFVLKVAGAWLGAGGIATRARSTTA